MDVRCVGCFVNTGLAFHARAVKKKNQFSRKKKKIKTKREQKNRNPCQKS